ncbi:hypothetical protein GPECTOR_55g285 [Gonium pectorale]|uniref:Uncharacterized protein n=1 Tax=Gonium pectorale TaxID=33097 RepID=A0A150G673_GONPE|nr:hypothetical protein GPECTOR_55g285 [Gonium pectorale]|eukprot:KXZ45379.1 hypothetical protein GPECTOR_55g285 [Gonium pectorale]
MWLLRVAMAHRKILIVDWKYPAAITNFLLPNYIDWTINGLDKVGIKVEELVKKENTIDENMFNAAVYEGRPDAVERFRNTKFHTIMTNQHFYINTMVGRARCLLTSRSGFSKMALWMGGGGGKGPILTCHRDMIKCEEEIVWRRQQRRQLRRGRAARRALLQLQGAGAA